MKNIDRVIEFIRNEEIGFNMSDWVDNLDEEDAADFAVTQTKKTCGTVACIGGTVEFLKYGGNKDEKFIAEFIGYTEAFEWLVEGIDLVEEYEPDQLFEPMNENANFCAHNPKDPSFVTREKAIRVLEHLRDTGELDWSV